MVRQTKLNLFQFIFASSLLLFTLSASAQRPPPSRGGGDHGGGSNNHTSTPTQVMEAIQQVQSHFQTGQVFSRQVFALVDSDDRILFRNLVAIRDYLAFDQFKNPSLLIYGEKLECFNRVNKKVLAAVVNQKDICLNVPMLMTQPPEQLFKQIYILMIHETAHIRGLGDSEVDQIHQFVAQNFEKIYLGDNNFFGRRLIQAMIDVATALERSKQELENKNPETGREELARAAGLLRGILWLVPPEDLPKNFYAASPEKFRTFLQVLHKINRDTDDLVYKIKSGSKDAKQVLRRFDELIADSHTASRILNLTFYGIENTGIIFDLVVPKSPGPSSNKR